MPDSSSANSFASRRKHFALATTPSTSRSSGTWLSSVLVKPARWMAAGLEQALGADFLAARNVVGRVNVPDDQWTPTKKITVVRCRAAGRNLPTQAVIDSTTRILALLRGCNQQDLCICLISGGGSALLELPIPPVSLEDLCLVTETMISNGAPIEALNAVRRRISQVKAGGLARVAVCRTIITLILSDIMDDRIEMIASGPTVSRSFHDSSQPNSRAGD